MKNESSVLKAQPAYSPIQVREGKPVLIVPGELKFPGNAWIKKSPQGHFIEHHHFVFFPKDKPDQEFTITPKGAGTLKWGYLNMNQDGDLMLSADHNASIKVEEQGKSLFEDQSYTVADRNQQVVFEWPATGNK